MNLVVALLKQWNQSNSENQNFRMDFKSEHIDWLMNSQMWPNSQDIIL